jgi:hypothetical protein
MERDEKRRTIFPLRLAVSLKEMASIFAQRDGISINHFISLAVAEKISRLEHEMLSGNHGVTRQQKMNVAAGINRKNIQAG